MATTPCPGLQHETGDGKPSGYVANGEATKVIYQPEQFGDTPAPKPGLDLGFGRFRLHAPINKPEYYDEMCVFLGASYFRAMAEKGEQYGLSACGLAASPRVGSFSILRDRVWDWQVHYPHAWVQRVFGAPHTESNATDVSLRRGQRA